MEIESKQQILERRKEIIIKLKMKISNTFELIIAIVVSELAGIIGSVFTTPSIAGWYAGIVKPS